MNFKDRQDAGRQLAEKLADLKLKGAVIYALPRGGVVVAAGIAKDLHLPLDLIITRKIGHPLQKEYAIGAVSENGQFTINEQAASKVDKKYLEDEIKTQVLEAQRRRKVYLGERKAIPCQGGTAILVDDGIATGLTMKAAIRELRQCYNCKKIIVAVPVIPAETAKEFESEGVELVAVYIPDYFLGAIGSYYREFNPVSDEEVIRLMKDF